MVLRSKTAPKFESPELDGDVAALDQGADNSTDTGTDTPVDTGTVTQEAAAATAAAIDNAAPAPEAAEPTPVAVVAPAATSVATNVVRKFQPALKEFENVLDPTSLAFNTFNRVTVDLGGFEDADKNDLGDTIKLQMMSYNERFVVSPGVQDDDATQHVRYSLDGKTIEGTGESVNDYLKKLRDVDGYTQAAIKKYLAIYGFLVEANGTEIPMEDRQIIEIQVPPMSVPYFTRHTIESGVKISQGILPPSDVLVCRSEKQQGKTTKYAAVKFSSK